MSAVSPTGGRWSGRRLATALVAAAALLVAGALIAWAVGSVLRPAEDPVRAADHTYVEVAADEVGASLLLNVVAEWTPEPVGDNRAVGIVTQVLVEEGAEVDQGTVLYSVDLRPVVIARGEVPAFRNVSAGSVGEDVRQVQQMLDDLGFYSGTVDGEAGWGTASAIREWQKGLGVEQTGVVASGDIVFVPSLPTRVALDADVVYRGATLIGGEQVVSGLSASPNFTIPVTDVQASMIPTGTRVEITSPEGGVWEAKAIDQQRDEQAGTVTIGLTGLDDRIVCGDECGQIPVTGQSTLFSRIVTVETVSGLVVPSAALVTDANGQVAVIDETGDRIAVTVVTSARGMSVIDGVAEGMRVRVPAGTNG